MLYVYYVICILSIIIGVILFKNKLNPISIYSMIWLGCVFIYNSGLIYFYPLNMTTILILIATQVVFTCGAIVGFFLSKIHFKTKKIKKRSEEDKQKIMKKIIIGTCIMATIDILPSFIEHVFDYGLNIFSYISTLYQQQLYNLESSVDLSSFVFVALAFSSIYIYKFKFERFILFPIILTVIGQLQNGSRGSMLCSILLFLSNFIIFRRSKNNIRKNVKKNYKAILLVLLMISVVVLITVSRTSDASTLPYSSELLAKLPFAGTLYSILLYLSSPIGCLNGFFMAPIRGGAAELTFRVPFLLLNKLGITDVSTVFRSFTYATPIPSNAITYIGELYLDFGYGTFVVIFILAMLFSLCFIKIKSQNFSIYNVTYSILFVIFVLSFFVFIFRLSILWYVLVFGIIFSIFIDFDIRFIANRARWR